MSTCKKSILGSMLFLTCVSLYAEAAVPGGEEAEITRLTERIYRITFAYSLRTNIGLSIGEDGLLLVDTGFRETAEDLKELTQEMGKGEIKYIIHTHPHGDHVGGTSICGKNATIVDYESLGECLSYGVVFPGNGDMEGRLDASFGTHYSLNFNSEKIQLIPCPGMHSEADLVVYFSGSGVVHMGDLLLTQSFPAVGPHVDAYMRFLEKAIDFFPEDTQFIAGHGRDYTLDDLISYRDMLLTTIAIVRREMNEGKKPEQIIGEKVLKKWNSWGEFLPFLNVESRIESIYMSYT